MSSAAFSMSPDESRYYDLGRQAREADFEISACNMSKAAPLRAWWVAGWHDRDMEIKQEQTA
jgi:hypothetical protein